MTCLSQTVRTGLRVYGQVQGVGFRPFIFTLANHMSLDGWVRNVGIGVEIEIQGSQSELDRFILRLTHELPRAARIDRIERETRPVDTNRPGFAILDSTGDITATSISPDSTVCDDCLADMFDPSNRRYRHPFTHCVQCGPRYTISKRLPYDRANTSMAAFVECAQCRSEREHAGDRRFHAQTNACPSCGPRLWLADPSGALVQVEDVIAAAFTRLAQGEILAIKGIGGFHLACDARNGDAVRRLRERKAREEKPFAVMFSNLASIPAFASVREIDAALLSSAERPIVLLPKHAGCDGLLPGVAPQLASLGCMLPYAPLHYLLFHEAAGRPAGMQWLDSPQPTVLVMTSANPHGEPLVTDNAEALERLSGIADAFLLHDREILIRCDDSVVRTSPAGRAQFVRRSRGYVPSPVPLAVNGAPGIAVGANLNNTVCVTRSGEAFLSEHIGDLETRMACVAFDTTVSHLLDILQVEPRWVACDLQPDFHSARFARAFANERGLPLVEVQHHHAHIAAVMAEHGLHSRALGLALDGFGLGSDGGAWGGRLLLADGAAFKRLGHLRQLRLPGLPRSGRPPHRKVTSFEGQTASMLEGLAIGFGDVAPLQQGYVIADGVLDMMPLLAAISGMEDKGRAAALFHATLASGLAEWAAQAAAAARVEDVVLGGGCFINTLLSSLLRAHLEAQGLRVFQAEAVPSGDGGLSLGQAWIALRQLDR